MRTWSRGLVRAVSVAGLLAALSATPGTTWPVAASKRQSPSRQARQTRSSTGVDTNAGSKA